MRYTGACLSEIATFFKISRKSSFLELDTEKEPIVDQRLPNLLVNGSTGIQLDMPWYST